MILYQKHEHGNKTEKISEKILESQINHIKIHSEEKLFILIKEKYFKTKSGIKFATPMLEDLKRLINNH